VYNRRALVSTRLPQHLPHSDYAASCRIPADGTGAVESLFTGSRAGAPQPTHLMGVEVIECRRGKITELRDYHTVSDVSY
jgi:hypothetical protein